ncbi:MAG: hypothetical protein KJ077_11265 [Anaerolineae bacterium]|nr:hypothetical protein [Anaerolineae bacterium]
MIFNFSPYYQIDLRELPYRTDGVSVLAMGNRGAGKSTLLAVGAEEAHTNRLPFLFFDINGDACSLRELGDDVMVVGRVNHREPLRQAHFDVEEAALNPGRFIRYALGDHYKVIFDLSGRQLDQRVEFFAVFAEALYELSEDFRYPCVVAVDECHIFAPQGRASKLQARSLAAFELLISDGRKRGLLAFVATQWPQQLNKNIVRGCTDRLIGKMFDDKTFKYLQNYIPPSYRLHDLKKFPSGRYIVNNYAGWSEIQIRPRRTSDLGATPLPLGEGKIPSVAALLGAARPSFIELSLPREADHHD